MPVGSLNLQYGRAPSFRQALVPAPRAGSDATPLGAGGAHPPAECRDTVIARGGCGYEFLEGTGAVRARKTDGGRGPGRGAGRLSAETVLITGANSGLGLEFTKQYAAKGWTVIATHRRREMPEDARRGRRPSILARCAWRRSTSPTSTQARALAAKLADVPIDVLINNAGVYNDRSGCASGDEDCPGDWTTQSFGQMNFALLDTIMAVNIKGPLIVSQAFYPT